MNEQFMLKNVLIDCERMRHPHTGLYHYCLQLGNSILKKVGEEKEKISFYLPTSAEHIFGEKASYISQHFIHKLFFPDTKSVDVWHCTYQGSKYFPFGKKVSVILTIHDLNFLYDGKRSEKRIKKYLNRLQLKIDRADHIVAISYYVLEDLKKHLELGDKPTSVIYNGCNIDDSVTVMLPRQSIDQPFLFTIGTIVGKKNFHVLPALLKDNDLRLVIAGIESSQEYKKKIIREAQNLNVLDRLIFTGPISENDKKWYLSNCTAFVFPSIAEGFGLPVIEAMYYGKPVILSRCTSLPEIGGDCAYYFDNFEPDHMRNVLTTSLEHYNKTKPREKIRERARFFSWERAASEYLALYQSFA
ncbi:glycosyltransferase family 4 protein [Dyadobacter sp. CY261]|uniref:glycosyltransferase family 4 protein n=1 Tax=Dyadobacter sp. CY261 TaxID=2907203 RepID=UPI001F37DC5B|nr:glycosyltransferase family 1 protein [Dyadobacter sp. CY261]MCF0071336.1 glycosyltransferase family 4 protein [Dyadobacter sp. CY261]